MRKKKTSPLEHVLGRLDDLDPVNLTNLAGRLARERQLLETVFNTVREGILVADSRGKIQYANAAAARLLGFKRAETSQPVLWKLAPALARTFDFSTEGSFKGRSVLSREFAVSYPENRFLRLYAAPFPEDRENAGTGRFLVILSDITRERENTQRQIEDEKISSLKMLAAGVAHELGNPINSLTIHLQLLRRQVSALKEKEAARKILKSIDVGMREVARLDGILNHFLDALRPKPPDLDDANLFDLLEESLEVQGYELSDAGVTVSVERPGEVPVVLADHNQIKQVYFNVLKNAAEAMPGGGEISVRSREDDDFFYLLFADTGHGISGENLGKVFQPYFSTKKEGHGLGMMIVDRIMREHGGQVGLDSRTGAGTIVTLHFPKKHRRVRLLPEQAESVPPPAGG